MSAPGSESLDTNNRLAAGAGILGKDESRSLGFRRLAAARLPVLQGHLNLGARRFAENDGRKTGDLLIELLQRRRHFLVRDRRLVALLHAIADRRRPVNDRAPDCGSRLRRFQSRGHFQPEYDGSSRTGQPAKLIRSFSDAVQPVRRGGCGAGRQHECRRIAVLDVSGI